jgi:tetratricopeptide (TPR) repeat protein
MHYVSSLLKWIFLFLPVACATGQLQSEKIRNTLPPISDSKEILNVPFVEQDRNECGPATLTMVLRFYNKDVHVDDLLASTYSPKKNGTLQSDLIGAARRQGMMAIVVRNFPSALMEVDAGNPIIVFENLGLSWYPQWHYAVLHGYNLNQKTVTLHSGPNADIKENITEFEKSWRGGDYWSLLVFQPEQLAASASELDHIASASALEEISHLKAAETAYSSILQRWPESLGAHIGLGNIYFKKKDYKRAVNILEAALKKHPHSKIAQHNLETVRKRAY